MWAITKVIRRMLGIKRPYVRRAKIAPPSRPAVKLVATVPPVTRRNKRKKHRLSYYQRHKLAERMSRETANRWARMKALGIKGNLLMSNDDLLKASQNRSWVASEEPVGSYYENGAQSTEAKERT